jgi:hypothetical protein
MTNNQIIYETAKATGLTDAQLLALMEANHGDLPYHTYEEWSRRGYHVKAGEKALFAAALWKYTDKPTAAARQEAEIEGADQPEGCGHYYRKLSYLFGAHQVEADAPTPALPDLLQQLQQLPGVTVAVNGAQTASPVVWLEGNTAAQADAIKSLGGRWSKKKQAYFFRPACQA